MRSNHLFKCRWYRQLRVPNEKSWSNYLTQNQKCIPTFVHSYPNGNLDDGVQKNRNGDQPKIQKRLAFFSPTKKKIIAYFVVMLSKLDGRRASMNRNTIFCCKRNDGSVHDMQMTGMLTDCDYNWFHALVFCHSRRDHRRRSPMNDITIWIIKQMHLMRWNNEKRQGIHIGNSFKYGIFPRFHPLYAALARRSINSIRDTEHHRILMAMVGHSCGDVHFDSWKYRAIVPAHAVPTEAKPPKHAAFYTFISNSFFARFVRFLPICICLSVARPCAGLV